MYKFPVTKNGIEYAVKITNTNNIVNNGYDDLFFYGVKHNVYLYKKIKLFNNFSINKKIKKETNYFNFEEKEQLSQYIQLLEEEILYQFLSNKIIESYEVDIGYKNMSIKNKKSFIDWDGNLDE